MKRTKEQLCGRALAVVRAAVNRAARLGNGDAACRLDEVEVSADGYAEPGYDGDVIAFGNWNGTGRYQQPPRKGDDLPPRVARLLEKLGVDVEWSDEWDRCSDCGKAFRTSPSSYSWQRSFVERDGEVYCEACAIEDPEALLRDYEGEDRKAVTLDVDPSEHGYARLPHDFESGFHEGQADDPKKIGAALRQLGVRRYLFKLDEQSQFYLRFSCWVHGSEVAKAEGLRAEQAQADVSPAQVLRDGLRRAAIAADAISGDGVAVVKIDGNGEVHAKLKSPQDFIDGRALE